jgi:hypothetical protein
MWRSEAQAQFLNFQVLDDDGTAKRALGAKKYVDLLIKEDHWNIVFQRVLCQDLWLHDIWDQRES